MLKELVGWLHLEEALQGLFNLLEKEKGEKTPNKHSPTAFKFGDMKSSLSY